MLDIKRIREKTAEVYEGLRRRGADPALLDQVLELDKLRRASVTKVEELKNRRNARSKEIGAARKRGEDTAAAQAAVRAIGDDIGALDESIHVLDTEMQTALLRIPNVPCLTIPTGPDASGNRVARVVGTPRTFAFTPRDHVVLAEKLGILDLERATRMTGSGFPLLKQLAVNIFSRADVDPAGGLGGDQHVSGAQGGKVESRVVNGAVGLGGAPGGAQIVAQGLRQAGKGGRIGLQ